MMHPHKCTSYGGKCVRPLKEEELEIIKKDEKFLKNSFIFSVIAGFFLFTSGYFLLRTSANSSIRVLGGMAMVWGAAFIGASFLSAFLYLQP